MTTIEKAVKDVVQNRGRRLASQMQCPVCNSEMKFTEEFGKYYYVCSGFPRTCDVTLGSHPNGTPMGKPADNYTRRCRAEAHSVFDPLWQEYSGTLDQRGQVRPMAYRWLADQLKMSEEASHIGNLNAPSCKEVVRLCKGMTPQKIVDYCKAKDAELSPEQKLLKVKGVVSQPRVKPTPAPAKQGPDARFGVVAHATEEDIKALGKVIREVRKRKEKEASQGTVYKPALTGFNIGDMLEKALKEKK